MTSLSLRSPPSLCPCRLPPPAGNSSAISLFNRSVISKCCGACAGVAAARVAWDQIPASCILNASGMEEELARMCSTDKSVSLGITATYDVLPGHMLGHFCSFVLNILISEEQRNRLYTPLQVPLLLKRAHRLQTRPSRSQLSPSPFVLNQFAATGSSVLDPAPP